MSLKQGLWTLCVLLLGAACAEPVQEPRIELQVSVQDDSGGALAAVPVAIDGVQVATSDARGQARAVVHAAEAGKVRVSAQCPSSYRSADARVVSLGARASALTLALVCKPVERKLAVVVRAPGAEGAWVRADGEPLGRLDSEGTLHALVKRAPDSTLRLTIDTSEAPRLWPQHPVRELRVADRDDIVVFDQAFTVAVPTPRTTRTARTTRKAGPSTHVPYAIGRAPR
jgi:hypothetical protein